VHWVTGVDAVQCKYDRRVVRCGAMKTASVQAVIAVAVGLALGPTCQAADTADGIAKVRDDASSLGHSVAKESKLFGHAVAEKSGHAGHAFADTARRIGIDIKAGAQHIRTAVVHDGPRPQD
jgi:hypothetical protein